LANDAYYNDDSFQKRQITSKKRYVPYEKSKQKPSASANEYNPSLNTPVKISHLENHTFGSF
jgi:hypothetical protein